MIASDFFHGVNKLVKFVCGRLINILEWINHVTSLDGVLFLNVTLMVRIRSVSAFKGAVILTDANTRLTDFLFANVSL